MKKVFLFSGQGSQYVGMLKDYYDNNEYAKNKLNKANQLLGFNIKDIMFDGPKETLTETRYTQVALFLHSSIAFDLAKDKLIYGATAGHSVGEYAALYAAGVLSFENALELVALRGKLMFESGTKKPGTMFAVIGMSDDEVEKICNEFNKPNEDKIIVPANYNSPGQLVISGSKDYLNEIAHEFKVRGARMVKELQVSGAFHSPLLNDAKDELADKINSLKFNNANVPVYANVNAEATSDSNELKQLLIRQLVSPVKWTQTLNNLHKDEFTSYYEIGPSNVLQGLVKRTLNDVEIFGIDKYEDLEKIS
jgi:[acyl-carrier-protein] S-malonyltransferase